MLVTAPDQRLAKVGPTPGDLRFAAVISHPIQHYVPVFRELAAHPGFDVKVFYACDWGVKPYHDAGFNCRFAWDVDLLSGYEHEFLPQRHRPDGMGFWQIDHPAIGARLDAFQPHAIWLHGYGHRICWRAAAWARRRAALIHFGDSELVHHRSWWRRIVKTGLLRWHFGRCDAFITIGDNNDAYYRHYGVPDKKLFRGVCPIDLTRFRTTVASANAATLIDVKQRYGFPGTPLVALWVGKLEPRKRPGDFVAALHKVQSAGAPLGGVLVGDGPVRDDVERQIRHAGLADAVRITGFVNQGDMPLVLQAGDWFVTTSAMDPHPLVVTESMAVGLPIVASDRVGCIGATDTARPGVNALTFPCGDVDALADHLRTLMHDEPLRRRLAQASYELAGTQAPKATVKAVVKSLLAVKAEGSLDWHGVSDEVWDQIAASVPV